MCLTFLTTAVRYPNSQSSQRRFSENRTDSSLSKTFLLLENTLTHAADYYVARVHDAGLCFTAQFAPDNGSVPWQEKTQSHRCVAIKLSSDITKAVLALMKSALDCIAAVLQTKGHITNNFKPTMYKASIRVI